MRLPLIAAELAAAGGLLAAVVSVAPGEAARLYALATIIAIVLPGLMLTGDIKLINAGLLPLQSRLRAKAIAATLLNLPLVGLGLSLENETLNWQLITGFIFLGVAGATAQAFSSTWYYVQTDQRRMLRIKLGASAARLGFATAAVLTGELMLALVGNSIGSLIEFTLNFRTLPWVGRGAAPGASSFVSPLGAAYGVSRIVSAGIKLGLAQWLGPLIASFVVIEQLVGGLNALSEKYFLRSTRWRGFLRGFKLLYLTIMLGLLPWLATLSLVPERRSSLLWLALLASASLLPLTEMYTALRHRGERFVAAGSAVVSASIGSALLVAWVLWQLPAAALAAYVLLPGLTFLFYWWSSQDVRHNPEHQAPR